MSVDTLQITSREGVLPGHRIVQLTGPLTMSTLFPLRETLRSTADSVVILDFTGVPYMDSAGLGLLVHAQISTQNAGRRFAVAGMNERVRTVLTVTNVDKLFKHFGTATEAEAQFV
jgi:anti-sigma B factor antagonist